MRHALSVPVSVPLRLRARFGGDPSEPRAEPVTVTVARVVRPDRRQAFEREAAAVLRVASAFPGNLGATLLHPGPGSSEYHLVYRFADDDSLAAWENSVERRDFVGRLRDIIEDERYARVSGLDSFFTRPTTPGPRWRLTVLTIAAVFAVTSLFQLLVAPHLTGWPVGARLLLSASLVVVLLGHVMMPTLTRLFARWLRPAAD